MSSTGRAIATVVACLTLAMATVTPSAAATPPGPPTGVVATPGNASATVSWTAPVDNGGADISGYTVTSIPEGLTCSTASLSCSVAGLTNGAPYTFEVTATNSAGTGPASTPSAPVTPRTVPSAPLSVTTTPGNAKVTVAWLPPASNGGSAITSYTATASRDGKKCTPSPTPTGLTCEITGLVNGDSYTVTVVARNEAGDSPASTASTATTPRTTPGAPTEVIATPSNSRVSVSWSAPSSNGGAAITRYRVDATPGTRICSTNDSLSCTVTGLTNGESYTFTVVAINAAGTGRRSAPSNAAVPATVPSVVRTVTATRSRSDEVTVSWTAPVSTGGSPLTGYTVTSDPDGLGCTTTATSCTISGLTNGTRYTFRVTASNALGPSAGAVSNAVVIPKARQTGKVRAAKRVKYKGKTVLLKGPVLTSAGQRATATVAVTPSGKRYAKVIKKRSGKIIVRTKGRQTLRVRLTVTAPATAEFRPFAYSKAWRATAR